MKKTAFVVSVLAALSAVFGVSSVYALSDQGPIDCWYRAWCYFLSADGTVRTVNGDYLFTAAPGSDRVFYYNYGDWLSSWPMYAGNGSYSKVLGPFAGSYVWIKQRTGYVGFLDSSAHLEVYDPTWAYSPHFNYDGVKAFALSNPGGGAVNGAYVVFADGTANFTSETWLVDVVAVTGNSSYSSYYLALKSDGSVVSDIPGLSVGSTKFKQLSASHYDVDPVAFVGITTSDDLYGYGVSVPSGKYRSVSMRDRNFYCAANLSTSALACFDNSGAPVSVYGSSVPVSSDPGPVSGGSSSFDPSASYCLDFWSGSFAYDFIPVRVTGSVTETVPTFGFSDYFKIGSRQYDFRNLDFTRGSSFTGVLVGSSSGSVKVSAGSWFSPVDSYIDVKSRDGSSVNYLRLYGSGAFSQSGVAFNWLWTPTEYVDRPTDVVVSMIYPDWSVFPSAAPPSSTFTDYVKYTGSDAIVWWRIQFKSEDTAPYMFLNGIEIGYVGDYPSASGSCSTDSDRVSSVSGTPPATSSGGVLQDALNGVTTSTGISLGPLQDALNGSGTATGVSLGPLQDALNGSSVGSVSRVNDATASIAWSIGNYFTGVVLDDPVKKSCRMFSNTWKFLYKSNGKPFFVGINFVSLSDNSIVRKLLSYVQKGQTIVLEPFNLVLSSFSALWTVPDNTSVCFLGTAYVVKYQEYVAPSGQTVTSFHSLDAYKPVKGDSTFLDYLALFVFYVVIASGLYFLSKPSA